MSKAEEFIKSKIRIGSNTSSNGWRRKGVFIPSCSLPWLTPDDARKAIEIAREEVMDEVCDYIKNNLYKHLYVYDGQAGFPTHQFINDLKQAMKDE